MDSFALLLAATLNSGTVLAFAALGLLINERAGIVNLGAEGMMPGIPGRWEKLARRRRPPSREQHPRKHPLSILVVRHCAQSPAATSLRKSIL